MAPTLVQDAAELTIQQQDDGNVHSRLSFLGSPPEVRNRIYEFLLPDRVSTLRPGRPLRADGSKCSVNILRCCRQTYEEAASCIYDNKPVFVVISDLTGTVSWLNRGIQIHEAMNTNYESINKIRFLRIFVRAGFEAGACKVQDAMFHVLSFLRPDQQKLESIECMIRIADRYYGGDHREPYINYDVNKIIRSASPGDVNLPHLAMFLLDPLKTLRISPEHCKPGALSVRLIFGPGQAGFWPPLLNYVKDSLFSHKPIVNYKAFWEYSTTFSQLQTVFARVQGLHCVDGWMQWSSSRLPTCRVRGDVAGFRAEHEEKAIMWRRFVDNAYKWNTRVPVEEIWPMCFEKAKRTPTYHDQHTTEELLREAEYLMERLELCLPDEGTDTSFYGYALLDHMLRRVEAAGKIEEKPRICEQCSIFDTPTYCENCGEWCPLDYEEEEPATLDGVDGQGAAASLQGQSSPHQPALNEDRAAEVSGQVVENVSFEREHPTGLLHGLCRPS
jgi:hypothetical protein